MARTIVSTAPGWTEHQVAHYPNGTGYVPYCYQCWAEIKRLRAVAKAARVFSEMAWDGSPLPGRDEAHTVLDSALAALDGAGGAADG